MDFTKFIDGVAKAAEQNNGKQSGDYINDDDGLLYCGKCNTPKQCRVELFGSLRTVHCLCKCKAEKLEAEKAEQKRIEWLKHIQRLRKLGFPDAEMQKWTFDKDDHKNEQISKVAHNYVDNFAEMKKRGKGLLLYGGVGTGKTFISACIANALIDNEICGIKTDDLYEDYNIETVEESVDNAIYNSYGLDAIDYLTPKFQKELGFDRDRLTYEEFGTARGRRVLFKGGKPKDE
jgi:hypothetical protein